MGEVRYVETGRLEGLTDKQKGRNSEEEDVVRI
jgi:hypothetical protein